MRLSEEDKKYIYRLKALAIFCVICAHTSPIYNESGQLSMLLSEILNYLGTMGVPVFFLISGFLFSRNRKSFEEFWKGKIISIGIPWLFCGTFLWLYVVIRKGGIGIRQWFLFMIGYDHSTYYLTVLMVMYLLFWRAKKIWHLPALICLSLVSIVSTGWGIGIDFVNELIGSCYLNPLNWIVFFASGMYISQKNLLQSIKEVTSKRQVIFLMFLMSTLYFAMCEIEGEYIYYFARFALIAHVVNVFLILGLGHLISNIGGICDRCILYIGKTSFTIYLLHQFAAGLIVAVSNRIDIALLVLIRPFAVLMIVEAVVYLADKIFGKYKAIKILIGMR